MTQHAYEATILVNPKDRVDLADAQAHVARQAQIRGLTARLVPKTAPGSLLMDLGPIQVLILAADRPMAPNIYNGSRRPRRPLHSQAEILRRLTRHRSHVTVLVSDALDADPDGAAGRQIDREQICQAVTRTLRRHTTASLVFWATTDTLYADDEFGWATFVKPPVPADLPALMRPSRTRSEEQREIEIRAMNFIHAKIREGAHRPGRRPDLLPLLVGRQCMRAATVGCSASTVGLSAMQMIAAGLPGL